MKIPNTILLLKRWIKMFLGKSQFHQEQKVGRDIQKGKIGFYPSDMSAKLNWDGACDEDGIIMNKLTNGELIYFPIAIAQKALAHFDSYLATSSQKDKADFLDSVNFLLSSINEIGLISTWHKQNRGLLNNYSAMTQGEVISVFCRAYIITSDEIYLSKAIILSEQVLSENEYRLLMNIDGNYLFSEMPNDNNNIILNGHFFTLWGIMDLYSIYQSEDLLKKINIFLDSTKEALIKFDTGYWSYYDLGGSIASPFYHQLHINQLKAMYEITSDEFYYNLAKKWTCYQESTIKKYFSISIKIVQKLRAKKYNEFI